MGWLTDLMNEWSVILLALAAFCGAITATAGAVLGLWKLVLKPIRNVVIAEMRAWREVRELADSIFKTNGSLGLKDTMTHTVNALDRISSAIEIVLAEQAAARERGLAIQQQVDAVLAEQERVKANLEQLNGGRG